MMVKFFTLRKVAPWRSQEDCKTKLYYILDLLIGNQSGLQIIEKCSSMLESLKLNRPCYSTVLFLFGTNTKATKLSGT